MAQFKELLVFGTTRILENVYAKKFVGDIEGNITGNADTATKASQDALGQAIDSTYIKGVTVDGTAVTFEKGDGSTFAVQTQDTHVDVADDLVTADAEAALSANQGVVIAGRLAALEDAATWEMIR
jgi:hypothetical protein